MNPPAHLLRSPSVHPSAFVAKGAVVLGDVSIAENASVWYNAVLRGDINAITIGRGSQIGANSVVIKPVPAGAVVVGVPGQIVDRGEEEPGFARAGSDQSRLPDPLGVSMQSLLTRVAKLEGTGDGDGARVIRPPEAGVWHGEDFVI